MAKAINWPEPFREEILTEDTDTLRCALRPGTLYYDNQFWVDGEVVDVRVNHLKVRKAVVEGELLKSTIQSLPSSVYEGLKKSLKSQEAVMAYLASTYGQPVTPDSTVTVVFYKNRPLAPEDMESPEDARPVN